MPFNPRTTVTAVLACPGPQLAAWSRLPLGLCPGCQVPPLPAFALKFVLLTSRSVVIGVDDLPNPGLFRSLPDPFAVITVDGKEIHTTKAITKTLRPSWREDVDL